MTYRRFPASIFARRLISHTISMADPPDFGSWRPISMAAFRLNRSWFYLFRIRKADIAPATLKSLGKKLCRSLAPS